MKAMENKSFLYQEMTHLLTHSGTTYVIITVSLMSRKLELQYKI